MWRLVIRLSTPPLFLFATLALLFTGLVLADHALAVEAEAAGAVQSAQDYMTPDGRIDLDAARSDGFEGSLDFDGFDVTLDPADGSPRLRPQAAASVPDDQYWHDLSVPDVGMDNDISELLIYDGDLIAGGRFHSAGGTAIDYIARWDGAAWEPLGSGLNNQVHALIVYDGDLIVGGQFSIAGGLAASRIARWDGSDWYAMGAGTNNVVMAATVFNGELIVGGYFSTAGGISAPYMASWDGATWGNVGPAMNGPVRSLTTYNGDVIAGGEFTLIGGLVPANHIAIWNGISWDVLGTGMNNNVLGLTVFDGDLIAGGVFTTAGGSSANNIARWNGSIWQALGSGLNSIAYSFAEFNGELIVGGGFTTAGGAPANCIARWTGSTWQTLGSGMGGAGTPYARCLAVYNGVLVAAGDFTTAGGETVGLIAKWDGSTWGPLGGGVNSALYALTVYDGDLIVGGSFTAIGSISAKCVARWDGTTWYPLGTGTSTTVRSLGVYGGELIVGGHFLSAGGVSARRIARWDGSSWYSMGWFDDVIYCLIEYDGKLIAGGEFTEINSTDIYYVASWNGTTWEAIGGGLNHYAEAFTIYDGDLVVAGLFSQAGGNWASRVARWDGTTWHALGSGVSNPAADLAVYQGDLIVGGQFHTAGGIAAEGVARWDGSSWYSLGTGMDAGVRSLVVHNGELIAGGPFTVAGGVTANTIARWNGVNWQSLGSGIDGAIVESLTLYSGDLIAAGYFTTAGNKPANHIARWDMPLADVDGDGFTVDVDCDDNDMYTFPGAAPNDSPTECMRDFDGDGFGDESATGDITPGRDCDDSDASINPGAIETTDDGIDQDCNGADMISCYVDADKDGYGSDSDEPIKAPDGSCDMAQGESDNMLDCDDHNDQIHPGATEIPDDEIDQDCNGTDAITCYLDADQDGQGTDVGTVVIAEDGVCNTSQSESDNTSDCNDAVANIYRGATEIIDDGIDQDCNGADAITCYLDADQDGYGAEAATVVIAEDGSCDWAQNESDNILDCDDADAEVSPGADEKPDDGIDQDCNGVDATACFVDSDQDGYGTMAGTQVVAIDGSCDTPDGESDNMSDCDDAVASVYPGATEIPDDGIDQDCNGADAITCYVDADQDGDGNDAGATVIATDGSCDTEDGESVSNHDCDDSNSDIYPGATEIWYDGSDWNCDDNNDYDQDADGFVHEDHNAQAGGSAPGIDDCVDTDATINPDGVEVPDDGIDQDCDGEDLVATCCVLRVGDANGLGGDEPTIGDISVMIDAKFITGTCVGILDCFTEADINQSGGLDPDCDDITIGDISTLIDYLFITGPTLILPNCL